MSTQVHEGMLFCELRIINDNNPEIKHSTIKRQPITVDNRRGKVSLCIKLFVLIEIFNS